MGKERLRYELKGRASIKYRVVFITVFSSADADPCATNPCTNGGTCIRKGDGNYSCQCAQDYQGDTCEKGEAKVSFNNQKVTSAFFKLKSVFFSDLLLTVQYFPV